MKPVQLIVIVASLSWTGAMADPVIYGLINKEVRHVEQDVEGLDSYTGVTDVDGFETRLGVKGTHEIEQNTSAFYQIELGLNTARDSNTATAPDRDRIRLAHVRFDNSWGAVEVGKYWTPSTLRMLKLDPFTATGSQALGLESSYINGTISGYFGSRNNYFKNQIGYKTPQFYNLAYSITNWRSDADLDPSDETQTWTEHLLTYDKEFDSFVLNFHVTYAQNKVAGGNEKNEDQFYTFGSKFTFGNFDFSVAYGGEQDGQTASGEDRSYTHAFAGMSYKFGKDKVGFNYGMTDFGDKTGGLGLKDATGTQSQVAVGYIRELSKSISLRVQVKKTNRRIEFGTITGTTGDTNESMNYILGTTVKF